MAYSVLHAGISGYGLYPSPVIIKRYIQRIANPTGQADWIGRTPEPQND